MRCSSGTASMWQFFESCLQERQLGYVTCSAEEVLLGRGFVKAVGYRLDWILRTSLHTNVVSVQRVFAKGMQWIGAWFVLYRSGMDYVWQAPHLPASGIVRQDKRGSQLSLL